MPTILWFYAMFWVLVAGIEIGIGMYEDYLQEGVNKQINIFINGIKEVYVKFNAIFNKYEEEKFAHKLAIDTRYTNIIVNKEKKLQKELTRILITSQNKFERQIRVQATMTNYHIEKEKLMHQWNKEALHGWAY